MIGTTTHQSWLCYVPLAQQAYLLKDDLLDPVDHLLADPQLVALVRRCLAGRPPGRRAPAARAWPPIACCAAVC